jgi:hypothetical protein
MLALLMENGPCTVKGDGSGTTLNPWSWNTGANSACGGASGRAGADPGRRGAERTRRLPCSPVCAAPVH